MQVVIQKWGNSQGIRIPKTVLNSINLKESDELELNVQNSKIILEKIEPKRKTIEELFADYHGDYQPSELDWGEPVGDEIW